MVKAERIEDILQGSEEREYIELVGFPKSGKSHAIVSLALLLKHWEPDAVVHIIDTERGLTKLLRQYRPDNIKYYPCSSIDDVILTLDDLKPELTMPHWLCMESLSRAWDMAQDMGYQVSQGMTKAEYLTKRLAQAGQKMPVVPRPDNYWPIVKNAMERNFMDVVTNELTCNVLLTTTLGRERPREGSAMRESAARKRDRLLLGLDVAPEGPPRNPYYPDTVILMSKELDGFWATVLGDRGYERPGEQVRFKCTEAGGWYMALMDAREKGGE